MSAVVRNGYAAAQSGYVFGFVFGVAGFRARLQGMKQPPCCRCVVHVNMYGGGYAALPDMLRQMRYVAVRLCPCGCVVIRYALYVWRCVSVAACRHV
jgi:hypothetical protein